VAVAENGAGTVALGEVVVGLPEGGADVFVDVVTPVEGAAALAVVAAGTA
jgi:hypothetical protein